MSSQPVENLTPDYKVADITLADWGRKEISIAESVPSHRHPFSTPTTSSSSSSSSSSSTLLMHGTGMRS